MASIISAQNVTKVYDMGEEKVRALDGISLDVEKGEIVSIIGQSGSGKTTLLDIMSVLQRPTTGEVYINGKPISKMKDSELAKIRGKTIGFVFQNFNLINRMTTLENVMLPLWFQGVPYEERKRRAEKILSDVGLADRLNHKPTELSGGQRQRVAIARALAVNPDIIVADEPTGNLDSKSGATILSIFNKLHHEDKKTILVVTHEIEVAKMGERIIHVKDGKILKSETNNKKSIGGDYK